MQDKKMAYFKRKEIVRILAEKPDMMTDFPEYVLSARHLEEMAHIPEIALCDITMSNDVAAVTRMLAVDRPDAVMPVVVYGGTERARWSEFDNVVSALKKATGRFLHMLPPVVLGAPMFRSALCAYAATGLQTHVRCALTCAACLFYRIAVCIPLCKQIGINRIYAAGHATCCKPVAEHLYGHGLAKYLTILPGGYGIFLNAPPATQSGGAPPGLDLKLHGMPVFDCFAGVAEVVQESSIAISGSILQRYFETFAIPLAANGISKILSCRDAGFAEAARVFIHDNSIKKTTRH